jgi:S1/P1 Nuclease
MRKVIFAAFLAAAAPLFAWGPEGHNLVARIAEAQLTPAVHARVAEILGANATMASVSVWADQVRRSRPETAPWHDVEIPIHKRLNMKRDCPNGDCVIAKIADFRTALADPSTAPAARREALMFLIHFVGDMHQPLHCSSNKDHGGSDTHVQYNGRTVTLHAAWDINLPRHVGREEELFPSLSAESSQHAAEFAQGGVTDWAEEAHEAAAKIVYGKLPKHHGDQPAVLDANYESAAAPLIRLQLERAGARLARVLNEALQ